jgi:hypothetical protein
LWFARASCARLSFVLYATSSTSLLLLLLPFFLDFQIFSFFFFSGALLLFLYSLSSCPGEFEFESGQRADASNQFTLHSQKGKCIKLSRARLSLSLDYSTILSEKMIAMACSLP